MSNFASQSVSSFDDFSLMNQATANACTEGKEYHAFSAFACTEPSFAQGRSIGII
jgi:hypothetical protein